MTLQNSVERLERAVTRLGEDAFDRAAREKREGEAKALGTLGDVALGYRAAPHSRATLSAEDMARFADGLVDASPVEPVDADVLDVLRVEQEAATGRPLTPAELQQFADSF